ncbi:MAG: DUF5107 domain-containing protein [Anaerolineae bacterium]
MLVLSRCGLPTRPIAELPSPAAATARVTIEVRPAGSRVFVNGLQSGTTPASLSLPPGQHTVRIERDGYEPLVESVSLVSDTDLVISGQLVALPSSPVPTETPMPAGEPVPAQPLADLAVVHAQIELESGGACDYTSTQLGIRVSIENLGAAAAGPFVVQANDTYMEVPDGLAAGEKVSLWFAGYVHDGANAVLADATQQVEEIDESNNSFAQRLPVPTLPPTCTPPPGQAPTAAAKPATSVATAPTVTISVSPTATTSPPTPSPVAVTMWDGELAIPTYPYASFANQAWNETFNVPFSVLDRAAYDASNPAPTNVAYRTFVVENEYLRLTFLPDVGGRLYEVVYKPTGNHVTYRNPVLKPSPWGPPEQGWWLAAGGFEWCLPVEEHGYEWGIPWKLSATNDGQSATVTLRDTDANDRIRAEIAVRLEAGAGSFSIRPRLENPTTAPLDVKYWTNAMLAPGGRNAPSANLRFVLPDAVSSVTVHSRGDDYLPDYNERMPWPIVDGVDLGRLGNWNRWLGFFEDPAVGEFIAVYDEEYDEGIVRIFPAEVARGAKGFAFGWQDPISSGNWTDDGSSYVELHGGPSSTFDDSVTIPAGGELQWTETWYPVAGLGGLRYANATAALNLAAGDAQARVAVAVTQSWSGDLVLMLNGKEQWRQDAALVPGQPQRFTIPLGDSAPQRARLTLRLEAPDGIVKAEYSADLELK